MSVCTEITVDELADLHLDEEVQCQIVWRTNDPGVPDKGSHRCGKPAAVRVTITCHSCKHSTALFLCRECYDDAKKGDLHCSVCFMHGRAVPNDFSFREI